MAEDPNANAGDTVTGAQGADTVAGGSDTVAGGQGNDATLLNGGGEDDGKQQAAPASWPEDWKEKLARGDQKRANIINRYRSVEGIADALIAAQQKIRGGELMPALKENATEAEVAEWRKANGVPEAPDKYDLTLSDGLVVGEDDKPMVDAFLKDMHARNARPEVVKGALEWYYRTQDAIAAKRAEDDTAFRREAEDALRAEWVGPDYRGNLNAINNLLATAPEGVKDLIFGGRAADGRRLGDHPDVLRFFADVAREMNPAATIVPAGGNQQQTVETELDKIRATMRDEPDKYWADEKMQARYQQLLEAKDKMQARAA